VSRKARTPKIGLALAGGGPFGAIYEIGALLALRDCLEGLDLNGLDSYVGVSAGGFLAAALANGVPIDRIHGLFIEDSGGEGALGPDVFMRPAFGEYARRARSLPPLLLRSAWRYVARPRAMGALEAFAPLGRAIPTGLFDNQEIHRYLASIFGQAGHTNDFRKLHRRLYLVATDLDSGETVTFGRPGRDHVPISKAVQASAALPGLFPPVEIDGHFYVDGALKKTLHASEALEDGARLVLCVNPIVTYDADRAARGARAQRLVDGGLPLVLSQTFRAVIQSRLTVGLSKYRTQYRGADVVLFQPDSDDSEAFFTNLFGFAARERVCRHAYERTQADLARRARKLAPIFARHGLRLRVEALRDAHPPRIVAKRHPAERLPEAARELRETLEDLRRAIEMRPAPARGG
jgi:predicted acylesterase/phospholipase RssA